MVQLRRVPGPRSLLSFPRTIFDLSGGLEYSFAPIQASTSASLVALDAGGGLQIPIAGGVAARAYALGGYYFGAYNDFSDSGNGFLVAGGLGIRINMSPSLGLEVEGQYKNYLGLYEGVGIAAGIDIALGNLGGSVDVPTVDLQPAFPVFYKHYDDHPIGTLQIRSNLKVPASDIKAQVFIKEYMDSPKATEVPGALAPERARPSTCMLCSRTGSCPSPRAPRSRPRLRFPTISMGGPTRTRRSRP